MAASALNLLQQAIRLPANERAGLADELLESLHEVDAAAESAWLQEAQARLAAYRAGDIDAVDAPQVFADLGRKA